MNVLLSTNRFDALGLDWKSLLFYLGNFVILVTVLVLLLYKPIKKMLQNKRKALNDIAEDHARLKEESEKQKTEYDKQLEELKVKNAELSAEIVESAQKRAEAIVAEAQKRAQSIEDAAKRDALSQQEQLKNEYRDSVNRLAVVIAQKMLEREITDKDNAELIEQVLSDWEKD